MRGHKSYGRVDSTPTVSIKADWGQGVNTVLPADRLPPMQFAHGLNIGLREGYPVTRPGTPKLKWMYRDGAVIGNVFQGAGLIQHADPDPATRLPQANLVVCDNDLWLCAPNNVPTLLMEDCTDALQEVEIIDAFDEALILRNLGQAPLRYRYEAGHYPVALPAARSGQTTLPNAKTGCYAGNRIWLVVGKGEVIASDIFEWDYNSTETRWQIDDGEGDDIVRLWPVGEDRIVVFKTRSVHLIEGVSSLDTTSDPQIQITIRRVAAARGCVAPYAIEQRGQTLFYLGRDGLEALVLSDSAVQAMSDKPLSLAVEKYWKTLRWLDVAGARMTIAHQHLLISVPTRYREDETIPNLTLGGSFTDDPEPEYESVEAQYDFGWNVLEDDSPELTNYVEFPFLHDARWRADSGNPSYPYLCQFRGIVRLWESGTLQFIGEGIAAPPALGTPTITELSMKVWSGDGMDAGNIHTVFTVPLDSTWYPVDWSAQAAPGDHWEMYYGAYPEDSALGSYTSRFEMLQYPTGIVFPMTFWGGVDANIPGFTSTDMERDGNSIDGAYAVTGAAFASGHGIFSWHMDSTDWSLSNSVTHLLQSTLFPSSFSGAFTREIPDSATVGLRFQLQCAFGGSDQVALQVDFGPVFRTAYAPSIQQGVDPEA